MKSKLKIAGLMVFVLVFALSMTACDSAMDTGSDVTEEVEETGDLIVKASVEEAVNSMSKQSNEIESQSVIEERFSNFELIVKIKHESTGRVKENKYDGLNYDDLVTKESTSFKNIITGNWDISVTINADIGDYSGTTIAREEEIVPASVSAGDSVSANVRVVQEKGDLSLKAGEGVTDLNDFDTLELQKPDGTVIKELDDLDEDTWKDLDAMQYVIHAEIVDNGVTYTQDRVIMVLPGIDKAITSNIHEGSLEIDIEYIFPPAVATIDSAVSETDGIKITWSHDNNDINNYNIVRREAFSSRDDWTNIASNESGPEYTDDTAEEGVFYEYAVVAVAGDLYSDFSAPSDPVSQDGVYATSVEELNAALIDSDVSTIIVADGNYPEDNTEVYAQSNGLTEFVVQYPQTIKAENKHGATINGRFIINSDDVILNGLVITPDPTTMHADKIASAIYTDKSRVTIKNNKITGVSADALETTDANSIKGIQVYRSESAPTIEDIVIKNNTIEDMYFGGDTTGTWGDYGNLYGIYVQGNIDGATVEGNSIGNNTGKFESEGYTIGLSLGHSDNATPRNVSVIDNTFSNLTTGDGGDSTIPAVGFEIASSDGDPNAAVEVSDNNFTGMDGVYIADSSDTISDNTLANLIKNNEFKLSTMAVDNYISSFDNIQSAVNAANELVVVGPGTYNEEITIDVEGLSLKGTNKNYTTIEQGIYVRNNDITVENLTAEYIEFNNYNNIVINDNITTGNKHTIGIGAADGINNGSATITNNTLQSGAIGLYPTEGLENYVITDNTIESAPAEGIWLSYSNKEIDLLENDINDYLDDLLINNTIEEYDTGDSGAEEVKIIDSDGNDHSKSSTN